MTTIDFYFNATDRLQVACRLAGKALSQRKRMVVFAPQSDLAQKIDRMLWTWPAISFVPHCMAEDALAAEAPVVIVAEGRSAPEGDVLLNLADDCPEFFARYDRLLEIVSTEEADRNCARVRFAWYRDRGYALRSHDLAAGAAE